MLKFLKIFFIVVGVFFALVISGIFIFLNFNTYGIIMSSTFQADVLKNYDSGIKNITHAIQIEKKPKLKAFAVYCRADMYREKWFIKRDGNDLINALNDYQLAIQEYPFDPRIYINRAYLFVRTKDCKAANKDIITLKKLENMKDSRIRFTESDSNELSIVKNAMIRDCGFTL
jgi:tetratricopeptide (TPR) repeat protein